MNVHFDRIIRYQVVIIFWCLFFSAQVLAKQSLQRVGGNDNSANKDTLSLSHENSWADFSWLDAYRLSNNAYVALSFIADSVSHGLNPDDYHYTRLLALQTLNTEFNEADAQQFNLLLTRGLLHLIQDMSTGRLNPAQVDSDWSIPRARFDASGFLQKALQQDNFKACLDTLIPVSNQYGYIRDAVAQYQQYVSDGGWPKIPDVPVIRAGDSRPTVALIRERLAIEDNALVLSESGQSDYYDDLLEEAVKRFQRRYSLRVDGVIGAQTRRAMNVSAEQRLQKIKINLERIRWLPDNLGERYVMVNLANYRLKAVENNQTQLDMRVIVGKKKRPTPSFASQITRVVFNPHWYVPDKLARLDLLPKQQANPHYFEHYKIRVFDKKSGGKHEVLPASIEWQSVSKQNFPYLLVQDPGIKNALGSVKFIAPNPWSIYLHDTPAKRLFDETNRNFSSGCIRVEDPMGLVNFSLAGNKKYQKLLDLIDKQHSYSTKLEQPLTVYTIYSTVWCNGNELIFAPDTYNRDQKMIKYL